MVFKSNKQEGVSDLKTENPILKNAVRTIAKMCRKRSDDVIHIIIHNYAHLYTVAGRSENKPKIFSFNFN